MIGVHLTHVATHYQPHRMTRVATTGVANAWIVGPFLKPRSGVSATLMSFQFFGIWADLVIMVILFAIFVVSIVSINPTWNPRAATFLIVAAGFDAVQSRCGCSGLILYRGQPIKVKVKAKSHPHPHPHGFDEVRTSPRPQTPFQISDKAIWPVYIICHRCILPAIGFGSGSLSHVACPTQRLAFPFHDEIVRPQSVHKRR